MAEVVLWTLEQAGVAMAVSPRTVRRMQEAGELPTVYVGRARRVPAEAVRDWVTAQMTESHNDRCAGPDVLKGGSTCRSANSGGTRTGYSNVRTLPTTGRHSSTRAASELDALLASGNQRRGGKRRKRS